MIKVPTSRKDNGSFRAVIRCSQEQRTIAARWDNWTRGSLLICRGVLGRGLFHRSSPRKGLVSGLPTGWSCGSFHDIDIYVSFRWNSMVI